MHKFILVVLVTIFISACEKPAAEKSSAWCGEAYEDLEKLMTALKDTVPTGERDSIRIPKKKQYLKECHRLPVQAQKCLAVSFAQKNIKTCQSLNLLGEDKLTFQRLISGT